MTNRIRRRLLFPALLMACLAANIATGGVTVGRVDVEPSGGSVAEKPTARIAAESPEAGLVVSGGNRGDWGLGVGATKDAPKGKGMFQADGVLMASLCECLPQDKRGGLEVTGATTSTSGNSLNGATWVAGFTAAGNGAEANYDFGFAYFPFADGWIGGHLAPKGEKILASGNLPPGTTVSLAERARSGEIVLKMPGIDSCEDGMLFTIAAANGDNVTAVGPLEDGSGWHIRNADESQNFKAEEHCSLSFVYFPYAAAGLIGGWVAEDGHILNGCGSFGVLHPAAGRYEIFIPGRTGEDGILLVEVAKIAAEGVEDNAVAWDYSPDACHGKGGFVVESYDQPGFNDQDVMFYFAFIPFANSLSPKADPADNPSAFICRDNWADSMVAARDLTAAHAGETDEFKPFFSGIRRPGDRPVPVNIAVTGLQQLWLIVDAVDGNSDDEAQWLHPAFVMADGIRRPLSEQTPTLVRVGKGELRKDDENLSVHASSLLCYEVPDGAVRFEAQAGLRAGAGGNASVAFSVVDRHDRKPPWRGQICPALKEKYPEHMARLTRHAETATGLRWFDPRTCEPVLRRGLQQMEEELGGLTAILKTDGNDPTSLLRRYDECVRLLERLTALREQFWQTAPALSRIMDYPELTVNGLRAKLARIRDNAPALEAEVVRRETELQTCEAMCTDVLQTALAGNADALERLSTIADRLNNLAAWVDRSSGWTTFRGNNRRTGVSREALALPLAVAWEHQPSTPPAPAWPLPRTDNPAPTPGHSDLGPTLTYDWAHHVVTADGRVFYASSGDDSVVCLNAVDGSERWRFIAEGPVRTVPILSRDRIYAGSDDGWFYCLNAEDGAVVWRNRAGPGDIRLPGNGRMISQWPVRSAINIDRGVVIFGAGVFPNQGTLLRAVNAETGETTWQQNVSFPPQGFMLATSSRLYVPSGRTPFYAFDVQTGKSLTRVGHSDSWGRDLPGGTRAVAIGDNIATGPGEGGMIHLFEKDSNESLLKTRGRDLIVDGLKSFVLMRSKLLAIERQQYLGRPAPERLWEAPCRGGRCMIKVGDHIVVGCNDGLDVYAASDGSCVAHVPLQNGEIESLAYHAGRLFVSVRDGRILCLNHSPDEKPSYDVARKEESMPEILSPATSARAEALVAASQVRKGYALVLGANNGDLVRGLLQVSEMRVVCSESDAHDAAALRLALHREGLNGLRCEVHTREGDRLPYRPYLFNLIVADSASLVQAAELLRVLRPCGGVLLADSAGSLSKAADGITGETFKPSVETSCRFGFRRGLLSGSGAWTHGYGDLGNTACSNDRTKFGPMDILWFGRPGTQFMLERHIKGTSPLVDKGLLYVTGNDYLVGLDAYNGAILWENHLAGSGRMAMLKDCGNMTTADGLLYVATDNECVVLHGRTGREQTRFPASPQDSKAHWGYIAAAGDLLIGSTTMPDAELKPGNREDYATVWKHFKPVVVSTSLFALDRKTGRRVWTWTPPSGTVLNPTITILDGKVCFVESTNPPTASNANGKVPLKTLFEGGPRLTALALDTGKVAWQREMDLSTFHHAIYMSGNNHVLVLTGTRHDTVDEKQMIQYRLIGVDAATGHELWQNDNTPSRGHILDGGHGEQTQHPAIVGDIVYGPGFARKLQDGAKHDGWLWNKSPQCATLSASAHYAFSRQDGNPTMEAFDDGKALKLTRVTRPGCWINTIPAGGIVLIPEASSGCTCGYSVRTSLALCPRLEEE